MQKVAERREGSGRAFAATWRNEHDAIVGVSFGGTVCWFPRIPGRLRIAREGFEHVVRCRECPGCLEFDRRRQADRLVKRYATPAGVIPDGKHPVAGDETSCNPTPASQLFLVRIYAPLELHAKLARNLHRRRNLELEPGFWRLGTTSIGLIARSRVPLRSALTRYPFRVRIEPIKLRRGRRAWRGLTGGILIGRDTYGADRNRWYCRGLPPAEREKWTVEKRAYEKGYDRARSPRAWKERRIVLVPPEFWRFKRVDRVALRRALRGVSDPDQVAAVAELAGRLASARSLDSLLADRPGQLASREQVEGFYEQMRARSRRRREAASTDLSLPPLSEEGAYTSSVRSTESGRPPPLSDEALLALGPSGKPRWMERETDNEAAMDVTERARREHARKGLDAALERLRKKLSGRK